MVVNVQEMDSVHQTMYPISGFALQAGHNPDSGMGFVTRRSLRGLMCLAFTNSDSSIVEYRETGICDKFVDRGRMSQKISVSDNVDGIELGQKSLVAQEL